MARSGRAEQDLLRLCHGGMDREGVRREVLRALRRLIPNDAAFLATADPETLLFTGAWPDEPLGTVTQLFLDNEFGRDDVNKFATLATAARPVASLDSTTRRDRPASERYREIMRPLGLGDELRSALIAGGQCWGYLCLHREDHELGFTGAEAATLARVSPHIAQALRNTMLLPGSPAADPALRPGVVLLADDLSTIAMTPEAEHLLSLLEPGQLPLPVAVYGVAAALRGLERHPAGPLPSTRVRTRAGPWLNLHASRLAGPPDATHITVVAEPVEPRAAVPLMLSAHGLTAREAEVATLVLRGNPTRTISATLHISAHTVQDHLKAVFDKTGVRSRRDLVALLLSPPPP
ncbi:LuxR C-terminal-related transcriptional regulator [Amycolatopsis sp. NPDC050768]|uniref:LuxR C-terminal-related transcriptional regulator n=1 Tax=Amycolatopsis sp. NPDC050768 TaxID=3154839 RepID=UPI0033E4EF88